MNFKFICLKLRCKKSIERIDLSSHISFFYGQISAGKSSITRLIDFCLGGDLEKTPAITQELVSVELEAIIGRSTVLFERSLKGSSVQVTWKNETEELWSVSAPIKSQTNPIWNDNIFNLSDLIFYFLEIMPLKVHRSKINENSPLVRLSFRDILWYCYLQQDFLDSSFYWLEHPFKKLKSRDVMRFVVGYYNEKLNQLELELEETKNNRLVKQESIKQIKNFLNQFVYGSELDIMKEIEEVNRTLEQIEQEQRNLREEYNSGTHFVDELRDELRHLSKKLNDEKIILADLQEKREEQEALKAELLSAKFKLAQVKSADSILSGILFEYCPACGTEIDETSHPKDVCYLCGKHPSPNNNQAVIQSEVIRQDLTIRIEELDQSLSRLKQSLSKQYEPPKNCNIDIFSRYMTPAQSESPPLISYYRGS